MELTNHVSAQFNNELNGIRSHVLAMGGLVEQQLKDAISVLSSPNTKLASHVVDTAQSINAIEDAITEACTRVLAKRQPTASDLRFIKMVIKTISDLERIGNTAKKMAKLSKKILGVQSLPSSYLNGIVRLANSMLHRVLDAFARMDIDAAVSLYRDDDKIDEEYELLIRSLVTLMTLHPYMIPQVIELIKCAHSIERIGDRCQNISDYIVYYIKGKDVRHTRIEDIQGLLG
jgi:phosphate transport system protein